MRPEKSAWLPWKSAGPAMSEQFAHIWRQRRGNLVTHAPEPLSTDFQEALLEEQHENGRGVRLCDA
jgi:hypothetical protein